MDHDNLDEDQRAKLRQFKEIVNVNDDSLAIGKLASLDWNLEAAIEAQLNGPNDDDEDITEIRNEVPPQASIAPSVKPPATSSHSRVNHTVYVDSDDDEMEAMEYGDLQDESVPTGNHHYHTRSHHGASSRSTARQIRSRNKVAPDQPSSSASHTMWRVRRAHPTRSNADVAKHARSNGVYLNSNGMDDNEDEEVEELVDEDVYGDADIQQTMNNTTYSRRDDRAPLVPSDFTSVHDALQNFVTVFEARYLMMSARDGGSVPPFYIGTLQEAMREAFDAPGRRVDERRPLALYIHHDDSIAANIFAGNVMCSAAIAPLLRAQYITWAWDVTAQENAVRLREWLNALLLTDVRRTIDITTTARHVESYPLLLVLVKEKGTVQVLDVATGTDSADMVMEKLMHGVEESQRIRSVERQEERERMEREQMRQEQESEYKASLEADRARAAAAEKERAAAAEKAQREAAEEEAAALKRSALAASLPQEPPANAPNITTVTRRFRLDEPLGILIDYVGSLGFDGDTFRLMNSDFPKKDVSQFDRTKTLAELNWPVREQITVDER